MATKYQTAKLLLMHWEGFRSERYRDSVGVLTIGYGRTTGSMERTTKEAEDLYLNRELKKLNKFLNKHVTRTLNHNQMAALMSLIYNIGRGAFYNSTLRKKLNNPKFTTQLVSEEILVWVRAGDRTIPGLVRRRMAEWEIFNKQP